MRASGAGHGFAWRRRLRGRRARGGQAPPAALLDRGERRHRQRQGKGRPGLGAARSGLCPDRRPQPSAGRVPPGVGGAGTGRLRWARPGPGRRQPAERSPFLPAGLSPGAPGPAAPARTRGLLPSPALPSLASRAGVFGSQPRAGRPGQARRAGRRRGFRRGSAFLVPSQLCARRSWSCWDRTKSTTGSGSWSS